MYKDAKILFVIPAYNEEDSIEAVIDDVKNNAEGADIIVINDGSTDKTQKIINSLNVNCITLDSNHGYSYALNEGFKYAYKNHYDYIIQFDADGQHIASEAMKLVLFANSNEEYDIVIGSRFIQKQSEKYALKSILGAKILSKIYKLGRHINIHDPLSGLKCLNKKVIEFYSKKSAIMDSQEVFLSVTMIKHNFKFIEIPVKMYPRRHGKSMHGNIFFNILYGTRTAYLIFKH